MRSTRHARPEIQVRIGGLIGRVLRGHRIDRTSARRGLQRKHLLPHAVDADFNLMRLGQPFDQFVTVTGQP
jgi:hypothetical protein